MIELGRNCARHVIGLRRAFRRPVGLILLYHRICEYVSDPDRLCVTPGHFAEHLDVLSKRCHVVPLRAVVDAATHKGPQRPRVAITFDDGYVDNLTNALPALEHSACPATVFVATGFVGSRQGFWWEEMNSLLDQLISGPPMGNTWVESAVPHPIRDAIARAPNLSRDRVYRVICESLKHLGLDARDRVLAEMRGAAGERLLSDDCRSMTQEELHRLAQSRLVDVGAHSVNHGALASLPTGLQRAEIAGSKRNLETLLDREVDAFAYPHGGRSDYSRLTVSLVRKAGFRLACGVGSKAICTRANRFDLPRTKVPDCDGDEFAKLIDTWYR